MFRALALYKSEGCTNEQLMLVTPFVESLYMGQFTVSTQLIKS